MMELITPVWRKASHSGDEGTHCVEVAAVPGIVAVRDSKDPEGPKLFLGRSAFRRLANVIKNP